MTPQVVIFDIDNCIADDGWRVPAIDWLTTNLFNRYHRYHSLAPWDQLRNWEQFWGHTLDRIFFFTSRPLWYRPMTEHWLSRNNVAYEAVLMRNNHDFRTSVVVKEQQLLDLISHYGVRKAEIVMAYDDRPEIISMYKRRGVKAEVLAIHNTCAYTNPNTGINPEESVT